MILTDLLNPPTKRYYTKDRIGNSSYLKICIYQNDVLHFHQTLKEDDAVRYCLELEREGCHLKPLVVICKQEDALNGNRGENLLSKTL